MDKHTEDFVKKIHKELDVEKPSLSFTDSVMQRIDALNSKPMNIYEPIISKPVRYILCLGFIALVVFLAFSPNTQGLGWLEKMDWSFIPEFSIKNSIGSKAIPKTILYAVVLFGVLFWVQIGLLKHRHNSQFKI